MDIFDLKAEVARRGLTQEEVARRMGVSRPVVNQLLNGRHWRVLYIRAFSQATGIPMRFICECLPEHYSTECQRALELEAAAEART